MGEQPPEVGVLLQDMVPSTGRVLWRVTYQVLNFCSFSCFLVFSQWLFLFFSVWSCMMQTSLTAHRTQIRWFQRHRTQHPSELPPCSQRILGFRRGSSIARNVFLLFLVFCCFTMTFPLVAPAVPSISCSFSAVCLAFAIRQDLREHFGSLSASCLSGRVCTGVSWENFLYHFLFGAWPVLQSRTLPLGAFLVDVPTLPLWLPPHPAHALPLALRQEWLCCEFLFSSRLCGHRQKQVPIR